MSRSRSIHAAVILLVASATPALAHFHLDAPEAMTTQNALGDPQKVFPCGPVDVDAVPSGMVNNVMTGSMLTITVKETVNHPGHYRVALAQDLDGLPPEPPVTSDAQSDCGSAPIDPAPAMPVLADGLFVNLSMGQTDSVQVQLPAGMQCQNCVLQVLQFMSNHPASCFYHHCARINIVDDPSSLPDAGPTPGVDSGVDPGDDTGAAGGCCSANREAPGALLLGLAVIGLVLRRRRR